MNLPEFYTTAEAIAMPGVYMSLFEGLKRALLNTSHTGVKLEFEAFVAPGQTRTHLLKSGPVEKSAISFGPGVDVFDIPVLQHSRPYPMTAYSNRWLLVADEWFTPIETDWEDVWFTDVNQLTGVHKYVLWWANMEDTNPGCPNLKKVLYTDWNNKKANLDGWTWDPLQTLQESPGGVRSFRLTRGTREVFITQESLDPDYKRFSAFSNERMDLVVFLTNWDIPRDGIINDASIYQSSGIRD